MKKLIIGISGASGIILAKKLLISLGEMGVERHVIMSPPAKLTLNYELSEKRDVIKDNCDVFHNHMDVAAPPSSGSFKHDGMIILPCSVKTAAEISTGVTSNLLSRSADVCLKERRRLVLAIRETPLHSGHLRMLANLSDIGAFIAPPLPLFYARPKDLDELYDQLVFRYIDLLGLDHPEAFRWKQDH